MPGKKTASDAPAATGPSKAQFAALIIVIIVALTVAIRFASGVIGDITAENQKFGPSPEVLKKMSPPGHTPYGQPLKPGEQRPGFGSYNRDEDPNVK